MFALAMAGSVLAGGILGGGVLGGIASGQDLGGMLTQGDQASTAADELGTLLLSDPLLLSEESVESEAQVGYEAQSGYIVPGYDPGPCPCEVCCQAGQPRCVCGRAHGGPSSDQAGDFWLEHVKVGYDNGFVIASSKQLDLNAGRYPFRLRINGWGQLRHSITDFNPPSKDLNQFQLVRGRIALSGNAFNPNFSYFVQFDGRSTSGDDVRLLDYYLGYDIGNERFGLEPGTFGFRTGKYKVPFSMARWMSGRDFEFTDRSVASIFFDVNRSFAWGLYGQTLWLPKPIYWDVAIFNGLVTGGAETGSSGSLDDNFAYSGRLSAYPIGEWGRGTLADFDCHCDLAVRVGAGFASTTIDRSGTTEFSRLRVVDSGATLSTLLPIPVRGYGVSLYALDASAKYRGWSTTTEYYFRRVK